MAVGVQCLPSDKLKIYIVGSLFCSGSPFTDNFLLLTELRHTHLYQVALNGSTVQLRITSTNPMGAVYDPNIRTIFWVSQGDQKVMSSRLDGTELTIIKNLTSGQCELQLT